jgi:hypothetical protein
VDDLFTLLIIVMFVAPLIERIFKGARGQQQQPQRRPPQRTLPRPPQQRSPGETVESATTTAEPVATRDASDIIPGELWEILTGQKRPEPPPPPQPIQRPAPPPVQRPAPVVRRPPQPALEEDEEEVAASVRRRSFDVDYGDEDASARELEKRRARALEKARRVEHRPPVVVSLETEPLPEPRRHTAFHQKLEKMSAAPRRRQSPQTMLKFDPSDRDALQRAIILHEVLGRPRGLE